MIKVMRSTVFIDESRIWNFSTEGIDAANVRPHLFNYMTDEFWKISDKDPIRDFSQEILVHKDDFIRFVDKKLNTKINAVLYICTI